MKTFRSFKDTVNELDTFNESGQEQSLSQPVYDFFVDHRFSPMSQDALANMVIALDNTQIPEVKDWWHQSNSELRLANAYFHGFVSEAEYYGFVKSCCTHLR